MTDTKKISNFSNSYHQGFTPCEFEEVVSQYFQSKGFLCKRNGGAYDKGVDIIASKDNHKIAIQVKMYKERSVNYKTIMYLYAGKKIFDCQKGILITSGLVHENARNIAKKLGIEIKENWFPSKDFNAKINVNTDFSNFWAKQIMPLKNNNVKTITGKNNMVVDVSFDGVKRKTSNGKINFVNIEIFKQVYNLLLEKKEITRNEINHLYPGRASSFIVAIFSALTMFKVKRMPTRLIYKINERAQ